MVKFLFTHNENEVHDALGVTEEYLAQIMGEAVAIVKFSRTISEIIEKSIKSGISKDEVALIAFFCGRELGRNETIKFVIKSKGRRDRIWRR